ncbi:hypothetical protein [Priestia megaterium]|uniref:hypothetical protein n=1 Tax=Priestia megaterium TaxID=1404 RepID=UPI0031014438
MAKVNVNIQLNLNDEELKKLGITAEQYAESLTAFFHEFASPGLVVCQDVDNEKYGEKIVDSVSCESMIAQVIDESK